MKAAESHTERLLPCTTSEPFSGRSDGLSTPSDGTSLDRPRRFVVLFDAEGRCGCCRGVGDHPCGHECDSCDGSGRSPDSPICTLPHGADCTCTEARS